MILWEEILKLGVLGTVLYVVLIVPLLIQIFDTTDCVSASGFNVITWTYGMAIGVASVTLLTAIFDFVRPRDRGKSLVFLGVLMLIGVIVGTIAASRDRNCYNETIGTFFRLETTDVALISIDAVSLSTPVMDSLTTLPMPTGPTMPTVAMSSLPTPDVSLPALATPSFEATLPAPLLVFVENVLNTRLLWILVVSSIVLYSVLGLGFIVAGLLMQGFRRAGYSKLPDQRYT